MDSSADQSVPFATIDRCSAVTKIAVTAHTDFDEYEFGAVVHHEINLTTSCPVVSCDEAKTVADKEPLGCTFGAAAEFCSACF